MASAALLQRLALLTVAVQLTAAASGDTTATSTAAGQIRVNCGASVSAADSDGRTWDRDDAPSAGGGGVAAAASYEDPSLPSAVPYMTARVLDSTYTYSFSFPARRVFLRLYFYPVSYAGRAAGDALFGVAAAGVTLLRDFNASQTALALNAAYLVREFSLNVTAGGGNGRLDVIFTPSSDAHYAFVNGIEIVPVPADMATKPAPTLANGGRPDPMPIRADTAFQTMYRLNVGGTPVSPGADSGLLYRTWDEDSAYIYGAAFGVNYPKDSNVTIRYSSPPYAAPESVYATARSMGPNAQVNLNYNLTWILPVDAGFYYLLRLHFCEIQYPITKPNQRVFYVYVNNQTAQAGMDVIALSGGIGRPVFADYLVVTAPGAGQTDLWVALYPDVKTSPEYYDAILNGLEVFKLQTYDTNSLAGPNPPLPAADGDSGPRAKKKKRAEFVVGWAAAAGGLVAVLVGCFCAWAICRQKNTKAAIVDVPKKPVRETQALGLHGPTETYVFSVTAQK
ncbi:unnamed protein product [Urochloa decumbens]|uniref:Malectin-like domain-containing protein n=1 Tax=Urochloa decumbens TaxID=240449 RepID=A0ABC9D2G7_9POAL